MIRATITCMGTILWASAGLPCANSRMSDHLDDLYSVPTWTAKCSAITNSLRRVMARNIPDVDKLTPLHPNATLTPIKNMKNTICAICPCFLKSHDHAETRQKYEENNKTRKTCIWCWSANLMH
jgi:RNase P subunit RPR2